MSEESRESVVEPTALEDFYRLGIPVETIIYCLDTNNLVAVDAKGRSSPVGLANNPYKEFFVTSDELAVLRSNNPLSEGIWNMGFVVKSRMMQ